MDKVDLMLKIKQLEKENLSLKSEVKQLKNQIKRFKQFEKNILNECDKLSAELAKWKPFDDYDEIIYKK